ncbi:hypothetical protein GCM10009811_25160 [Nostocoides veronense]|uniref:Uncharacterized protein n=1 Tax=Nostocoides veronense TaxID=330836 RepID=A0ABP4Y3C0_9MICO
MDVCRDPAAAGRLQSRVRKVAIRGRGVTIGEGTGRHTGILAAHDPDPLIT